MQKRLPQAVRVSAANTRPNFTRAYPRQEREGKGRTSLLCAVRGVYSGSEGGGTYTSCGWAACVGSLCSTSRCVCAPDAAPRSAVPPGCGTRCTATHLMSSGGRAAGSAPYGLVRGAGAMPCAALPRAAGARRHPTPASAKQHTPTHQRRERVLRHARSTRVQEPSLDADGRRPTAGKLTRPRLHNCHELKRKCTLVLAEFESTVPWVHTACKHCAWGLLPCCGWRAAGWPSMRLSRPWRRPSASSCHTPTSMSSSSSCARPSQRCAAAPVPCYI